ncbi:MAG: tRNA pseudouridine(38-40) synthase TruA, partial [Clostridiales Family XIII bacterium]|nr:tRNA pseudouridine(38-40) synthase TruA [Clostridiales Family XIII bacterium]
MAKNILIKIEYDGSAFRGWQAQRVGGAAGDGGAARDGAAVGSTGGADSGERVRTVQGTLERALSHVCGEDIVLNGTSRTDAGVHALGQAASFAGGFGIPAERIPIAVNNLLDDVRLLSAEEVPGDFHARFDAKGKTYCY